MKEEDVMLQNTYNLEEIKTDRLLLTPLDVKDVNRYIEIAKNMRMTKEKNPEYFLYVRFDYDSAKTDDDLKNAAMRLLASAGKSIFPEVTKRLNICLHDGNIIGYIGYLYNPQNEISSDLGIFLDPKYEHNGYALEAQKNLLAYYFLTIDDKIYLTIHPRNLPSYHLNTKCGAVKIGHTENSKYGSERYILVITRKKFIKAIFSKTFKTVQGEKQFLLDYLRIYNEL